MRKVIAFLLVVLVLLVTGCTAADPWPEDVYFSESVHVGSNVSFGGASIQANMEVTTVSNAATIMDLNNVPGVRFKVPANSVVGFEMLVVARDSSGDIALFSIENGSVKRAGVGTTTVITYTLNNLYRDDVAWQITVTALGATDELAITVIGDTVNVTKWGAVFYGTIAHF